MISISKVGILFLSLLRPIDWVIQWDSSYQERNAGIINMAVQSQCSLFMRTELGMRTYQILNPSWGLCVFKEVLSYVNKAPFNTTDYQAAIVGIGSSFTFESVTQMQNLIRIGVQALIKAKNGIFGSLEYNGEYLSGCISNQGQATCGYFF